MKPMNHTAQLLQLHSLLTSMMYCLYIISNTRTLSNRYHHLSLSDQEFPRAFHVSFKKIFILAVLGLGCGTWDLYLRHVNS